MKIKADRDIFRWGGGLFHWPIYSDFTKAQTAADVLIKAKMPTCSKNAQAKPTEDRSEGEKIINQ